MNKKFKIIEINNQENIPEIWKKFNLESYYAVLMKNSKRLNLKLLENFAFEFGKVLNYGKNNYVIYDKIFNENPFHFDGISTLDKKRIPDHLFFYVDEVSSAKEGKFKILNCESVLQSIDAETKDYLRKTKLEYYGYPTLKNRNPSPYEFMFRSSCIVKEEGKEILRMQIPSSNKELFSIEDKFVFCKSSNYRTKFENSSGKQTANIFKLLHKAFYEKDHLLEIQFEVGDLLITKNKFTFHGRHGTKIPLNRKMYRFQVISF